MYLDLPLLCAYIYQYIKYTHTYEKKLKNTTQVILLHERVYRVQSLAEALYAFSL